MMHRYGRHHQRLRAALLPGAIGKPCHHCGEMMVEGQDLDLDHDPTGHGYRGMAHRSCNRREGALKTRIGRLKARGKPGGVFS